MASFEDLKECLVPPDDPIGTGSPEEWTAVEHRIEFPLPSDYKQFVSTYGRGAIGDEVFVLSPFIDRVAIYHLESEIARERLVYRQTTEQGFLERIFDERHAYLGYEPRPAGLIPWGRGPVRRDRLLGDNRFRSRSLDDGSTRSVAMSLVALDAEGGVLQRRTFEV